MEAITIPVVVGEDRRLVIELPDSTPVGPAEIEVVVRPRTDIVHESKMDVVSATNEKSRVVNPALEVARAKFRAAGYLSTIRAPANAIPLSDEEIARIGRLPPGARPSEELVDEDRGPR